MTYVPSLKDCDSFTRFEERFNSKLATSLFERFPLRAFK